MQQIIETQYETYQEILNQWTERLPAIIEEAIIIQQIPASTFHEGERGEYIRAQFAEIGIGGMRVDDIGNIYCKSGRSSLDGPALLISAHLDTVFPQGTDLSVIHDEENGRILGPGLGDNSLALAGMLGLARLFHENKLALPVPIWWVATVGEEGLGNLRGMRRTFREIGEQIGAAIILEGIGLGHIYHAGLGVRRIRVNVEGPGGHSWLHAERPSAIHHLIKIGDALINEVSQSTSARSSFNIGLIDGGTSINTRAPNASLSIDLRAKKPGILQSLERQVNETLVLLSDIEGLRVTKEVIGDRPAATLSTHHPLVQSATHILRYLAHSPIQPDIGSTDANIPLAAGVPAVCIGLTTGGNAHTSEEYINTAPLLTGMQQLTLLALLATENIEDWQHWDATS